MPSPCDHHLINSQEEKSRELAFHIHIEDDVVCITYDTLFGHDILREVKKGHKEESWKLTHASVNDMYEEIPIPFCEFEDLFSKGLNTSPLAS